MFAYSRGKTLLITFLISGSNCRYFLQFIWRNKLTDEDEMPHFNKLFLYWKMGEFIISVETVSYR